MEEYPKRLYLEDGTRVTVTTAAEEALWRASGTPTADGTAVKATGEKATGKGATDVTVNLAAESVIADDSQPAEGATDA